MMAKTLEKETVAAIELAILTAQKAGRNRDLHAIAGIYNCTYQSVCYIRRRLEKHQKTGIDDRKKAGRKPLADQQRMAEAMRSLLNKRPELDQSAISDYLFDEFGVRVCQATISRLLKKNGIPHKISNKLYKKSKLFTTNPEGKALAEDPSRELAASALSELPTALYESSYKSPYPPPEVASANMTFNNEAALGRSSLETSPIASAMDMTFYNPPQPLPTSNLENYITPYG